MGEHSRSRSDRWPNREMGGLKLANRVCGVKEEEEEALFRLISIGNFINRFIDYQRRRRNRKTVHSCCLCGCVLVYDMTIKQCLSGCFQAAIFAVEGIQFLSQESFKVQGDSFDCKFNLNCPLPRC